MRTVIVNCADTKSESEFWQRYIDAVQPDGDNLFGRNLAAFWDAIEGGGPGWPGEVRLVLRNANHLAAIEVGDDLSLLDGLRRVATEATFVAIVLE